MKWTKVYDLLEMVTPLPIDCGELCEKRCCSLSQSGQGVYLFSWESQLYSTEDTWCRVKEYQAETCHYTGIKPLMLDCQGECPRDRRPLVCRLFPMAPYLNSEGNLKLILDPDALFICPLVKSEDYSILSPIYLNRVYQVWKILLEDKEVKENVKAYSSRIKDESQEPWRKLFNGTEING